MKPSEYERKWRKVHGVKDEVSAIWDALEVLRQKGERPANSFTKREYMKRFGISRSSALRAIQRLCHLGIVRRYEAYAPGGTYYMLVDSGKSEEESANGQRKKRCGTTSKKPVA